MSTPANTAAATLPAPVKLRDLNSGGAIYQIPGMEKLKISILPDTDARSPREEFDHAGTMVFFMPRYTLGDKHSFSDNEEFAQTAKRERWEVVEISVQEHSGICLYTTSFDPNDTHNHSHTAYIYITPEKGREEWGRNWREKARECMKSEVSEYSDYLEGIVYGFKVTGPGNREDSCWGFYGDPETSGCLEQAAESARDMHEDTIANPTYKKWQHAAMLVLAVSDLPEDMKEKLDPRRFEDFEQYTHYAQSIIDKKNASHENL